MPAVAKVLPKLRGAFALVFLFGNEPSLLIGARSGSPLAVGYGDGEMYLASDATALTPLTPGAHVVHTRPSSRLKDSNSRLNPSQTNLRELQPKKGNSSKA